MIILDSTMKLQVVLGVVVTTSQLQITGSWADVTTTAFTPGTLTLLTSGTTAVDVVAAPAANTNRQIKSLSIYNSDTAVATVTLQLNISATLRIIAVTTLQVGYSLILLGDTLAVHDLNGATVTATTFALYGALATYNAQTGTSYTVALSDLGGMVRCTNAAAIAFNIDTAAHVPLPANAWVLVEQGGAGIVTVTALTGVTLRTPNGATTSVIYDMRGASRIGATDEWIVW